MAKKEEKKTYSKRLVQEHVREKDVLLKYLFCYS